MENKHIGSNFDDFLKEENIKISEDEIKETLDILFDKLCKDESEVEDV